MTAEAPLEVLVETEVLTYSITLSSGKPAIIGVPKEMTDRDWLDYQAVLLTVVRPEHIRRAGGNPLVNLVLRR